MWIVIILSLFILKLSRVDEIMSVRNYNSTRTYEHFPRRRAPIQESKKKNIDYTEIYKLDGVPTHNVEAVNQFHEKREGYQRMQNMLKRKEERDMIKEMTGNKKTKRKDSNNGESVKRKLDKIRKNKKKKIRNCLIQFFFFLEKKSLKKLLLILWETKELGN